MNPHLFSEQKFLLNSTERDALPVAVTVTGTEKFSFVLNKIGAIAEGFEYRPVQPDFLADALLFDPGWKPGLVGSCFILPHTGRGEDYSLRQIAGSFSRARTFGSWRGRLQG
jgi:hypothetical protein